MVDPNHPRISIVRQCRLVSVARSSFYYAGTGESPLTLRLMRLIRRAVLGDAVLRLAADDTLAPPSGRHGLSQAGAPPDATAGVHALYQRPRTSQPHPAHRIYPTCCAICRSRGRTTCGARMLPTSPCGGAFCTWSS